MQAKPSSVIIVGGGVIGLSAACYALREGCEVTVLEANAADATNCSMGNAGMIVPSHFVPLASPGVIGLGLRWMLRPESPLGIRPQASPRFLHWLWLFCLSATRHDARQAHELLCRLNLESRSLFVEMAREADFGLTTRGLLMLCKKQRTLDGEAHIAEQANALGLRAEVLDAAGVAAVDPAIGMDVAGAVHFKDDAHLDPARFMEVLRQRILREGGRIEHAFRIEHLEKHQGRIAAVSGPAGRREADQFVIAGGVWTAGLVRQIGLNLPLVAGKGYSLTLREPKRLPQLCSILTEARVAVTPMSGMLRVAGTMEIGSMDERINRARVRGLIRSVQRYFPELAVADFEALDVWSGLRPVSPDGLPYLGVAPGLDNLIIATGHAMMGLSLAPVSGRIVADLLCKRAAPPSIAQLDVARFA